MDVVEVKCHLRAGNTIQQHMRQNNWRSVNLAHYRIVPLGKEFVALGWRGKNILPRTAPLLCAWCLVLMATPHQWHANPEPLAKGGETPADKRARHFRTHAHVHLLLR